MATISITGVGLSYSLAYDTNGSALNRVTFPYGGSIGWAYADGNYSGSRTQREVAVRSLSKDGSTITYYNFAATHDASLNTMRQYVTLDDPGGVGQKYWSFNLPSSSFPGLIASYEGRDKSVSPTALQQVSTTWTSAAFGPYISSTTTTMNPGTGSAVAKKVDQAIDQWGNLTSMTLYDYSGAVRRTYTNTYLNTSAYTSLYIRNRLSTSSVTEAGVATTLVTNLYDGSGMMVATPSTPREFDASYTTSFTTRGNVIVSFTPGGNTGVNQMDNTGAVLQTSDSRGVVATNSTNSNTNYAVPSAITVGS